MKLIIATTIALASSTQAAPNKIDDYLDTAADYAPETVEALKSAGDQLLEDYTPEEGFVGGYDKAAIDAKEAYKQSIKDTVKWGETQLANQFAENANAAVDYAQNVVENFFQGLGVEFNSEQFDKLKDLTEEQKKKLEEFDWQKASDDFSFVEDVIDGAFNFPLQFAKKNMDAAGLDFDYYVLGDEEFDALKKKATETKQKFQKQKNKVVNRLAFFKLKAEKKNFFTKKGIQFSEGKYDAIIDWLNNYDEQLQAKEGAEVLEIADLKVQDIAKNGIVAGEGFFVGFDEKEVKAIQKFVIVNFKNLFQAKN